MIKYLSSLCSLSRSSLSSILSISFLFGRKRNCFLLHIITVLHVSPGHWVTVTRVRTRVLGEVGILPQRVWDIFKGHARARITRLGNGVIPGHFNIIPGLFIMAFTFGGGLSGGYMMRLAGREIVDPVDATISQRCFDITPPPPPRKTTRRPWRAK